MLHFAPGPSRLYPGVEQWCQEALEDGIGSLSHRSAKYSQIHAHTVNNLKQLLGVPSDYRVFFVGSATEAMERTIQNCVKTYSYHLVNGAFSKRFAATARELGKKPTELTKKEGESFDPHELKIPARAELVAIVHNETSTGTHTPAETIHAVKAKRPGVLVAVDIVSSAPVTGLDMTKVDIAFFSVQKGFGLPAGLGVMIVSPAALKKAGQLDASGIVTGTYHSFRELNAAAAKSQTPETPNVLAIYLLGKVAGDMNRRGIKSLHGETEKKLALIHDIIENHPKLAHFVTNPKHRSRTVVTVEVNGGSGKLVERLETEGVVMGSGYGSEFKDRHLRIANFPAHSTEDIKLLTEILKTN
jgi:phosphoserine aminotransferase